MALTRESIHALVAGQHGDPFSVLGPHRERDGGLTIRAFVPDARQVAVVADGVPPHPLKSVHSAGLWADTLPPGTSERYRLVVTGPDGHVQELEDPYRFPSTLSDYDLHLLGEGTHYRIYDKLGAHRARLDGVARSRECRGLWLQHAAKPGGDGIDS